MFSELKNIPEDFVKFFSSFFFEYCRICDVTIKSDDFTEEYGIVVCSDSSCQDKYTKLKNVLSVDKDEKKLKVLCKLLR